MTMSCRLVVPAPAAPPPPPPDTDNALGGVPRTRVQPAPDHALRVGMPRGAARPMLPMAAPRLAALSIADLSPHPAPPAAWRRVLWWTVVIPGAWVLAAGIGIGIARLLELAR